MPELPEVETICRGIAPYLTGKVIQHILIRNPRLRWPILPTLNQILSGKTVQHVSRRAKYLLVHFDTGTLLIHLGMSGTLYVASPTMLVSQHDHVDFIMHDYYIRYRDPRRFGAIIWHPGAPETHPLLSHLGPEPLEQSFNGTILYQTGRKHKISIKSFLLNSRMVAGIGNIYANEALFHASINPNRCTNKIHKQEYIALASAIRSVLLLAIEAGGSSIKDFVNACGVSGYFQQTYQVYGRTNQPCHLCQTLIEKIRQGQRSSYFCPTCQPGHK